LQPLPSDQDDGYLVSNETLIRIGRGSIGMGRIRLRLLLADERDRAPISGPAVKPAGVRLATEADEPAILKLLLEDLAENADRVAPASAERIMECITLGTRAKGGFVLVIDDEAGHPIATAILGTDQWWWSDQLFLREIVLYVSPRARSGHAGSDLLNYEKWLSDQLSAAYGHRVFLLSGVTATQRGAPKMRLYARHMNPVGGFFVFPAIEGGLAL
jgi:hypothetical protein